MHINIMKFVCMEMVQVEGKIYQELGRAANITPSAGKVTQKCKIPAGLVSQVSSS